MEKKVLLTFLAFSIAGLLLANGGDDPIVTLCSGKKMTWKDYQLTKEMLSYQYDIEIDYISSNEDFVSFAPSMMNSSQGAWSSVIDMPLIAAAMANLPDGKVLMWSAKDKLSFGGNLGRTWTAVYDPQTNAVSQFLIDQTNHDMFCPGISTLPDGRLIVTGGSSSNKSSIYDPFTESWNTGGNMKIPRGYHSNVTLASGATFVIGGSWSGGTGGKNAEVWTEKSGWFKLPGVPVEVITEGTNSSQPTQRDDFFPWLWVAPNGKLFHAGPSQTMHWIDTEGVASWSSAGQRADDPYSATGNTVMYDVGKILKLGGAPTAGRGGNANNRTYIIDINGNDPVVTRVGNLAYSRANMNSVVLPTGEVLAVGGLAQGREFTDANSRLFAELWSPDTEQWTTMAQLSVPRNYHSTAILMKDGRVISAGGGLCGGCSANHPDAQIFSPPYLFNPDGTLATRPVITSFPASADFNSKTIVETNADIQDFVFIRLSGVTHSNNNDQRRIPVRFSRIGTNRYELDIPNRNILPPGNYMLFALNANGVPSVAETVKIGDDINDCTPQSNPDFGGNGLTAQYYNNKNLTNLVNVQVDPTVNFNWGSGSPASDIGRDTYSVRWEGRIRVPRAGTYTFFTNSDDGVRLWVDNKPIVDDWTNHPATERAGMIYLEPDVYYTIKLEYFEDGGDALVQLKWAGPGVEKEIIPSQNLFPENCLEVIGTISGDQSGEYGFDPDNLTGTAASAGIGNLQYQWEMRTASVCGEENYGPWTEVQGGSQNLSIGPFDGYKQQYRRGVRSDFCLGDYLYSNAITITNTCYAGCDPPSVDCLCPYSSGIDTDGDGLDDDCDLDDDNDGILDVVENNCQSNLALTATAASSSIGSGGLPSRINDGDANTNWAGGSVAHTGASSPHEWIELDLGRQTFLKDIRLWNRTDCCSDRASNAYLLVSSDPFPANTNLTAALNNATLTYQFGNMSGVPSQSVSIQAMGRYIRVQKSGNNPGGNVLNLAEIQVFGNCDSDNDGIINQLDADSDNDDCPDALEGGAMANYNDLQGNAIGGGVDENGIPLLIGAAGQSLGSALDASQQDDECFACDIEELTDGLTYESIRFAASTIDNSYVYEWDFGDGNLASGPTADHTYVAPGEYNVILTVEKSFGPQEYEAEDGALSGGTLVANNNAGYSGTGYIDYPAASGTDVKASWAIDRPIGESGSISIRYAAPGSDRQLQLVVNGIALQDIIFPATSSWSDWQTVSISNVELQKLVNQIEFRATSGPGPNIDLLTIATAQSTAFDFCNATQIIAPAPITVRPNNSNSILVDETNGKIWIVNPDNHTVTAIDGSSLAKEREIAVGERPTSLAQATEGFIWVVSQESHSISVLNPLNGNVEQVIALPRGTDPYSIVFSMDGQHALVSLEATGQIVKIDASSKAIVATMDLGPDAKGMTPRVRGLAMTADNRLLATRFLSDDVSGQIFEIDPINMTVVRTLALANDPGPDTPNGSRGIPNYLSRIVVSPDGNRAWIPSKKDNINRGTFRDGQALTHDNSIRAIISKLDLINNRELLNERIDFNNREMAVAAAFSPSGELIFVALQGNNEVQIVNAWTGAILGSIATGAAPRGLVVDEAGRLFVQNFMDRSLSVFDVSAFFNNGNGPYSELAELGLVSNEILSPQVLLGKQIFYNAASAQMSLEGYISCASCHLEGGQDGQVWDFTDRGEGLRNTTSLRGRGANGHGRLHWSANFDEIQDFEGVIRRHFGGTGFLSDADFIATQDPLGEPTAGKSAELDAIAAYVVSLSEKAKSPYRNADGSLSAKGSLGKQIFIDNNCSSCHGGPAFTDSPSGLMHDIGTIKASSGNRLGRQLKGIDTPTLRELWMTAPYLHDGSATTLAQAIEAHQSVSLSAPELDQLVSFLQQIDENESEITGPAFSLSITQPLDDSQFTVGESVPLAIETNLSNISQVVYYANGIEVASSSTAPYQAEWTNPSLGEYELFAKAIHGSQNIGTVAAPVCVKVVEPNPNAPTANLRTASLEVSENFELVIDFSTAVTGLSIDDFVISNGTILKDLSNVRNSYYVSVAPSSAGLIRIQLPVNSVQDNDGNDNLASNILEINYTPEGGGGNKPSANLRTASLEVSENFELVIDLSTSVNGLSTTDFVISNGTILKDLSNVGNSYYVSVEPSSAGLVSIQLPANSVQDDDGNGNLASNILEVNYTPEGGGGTKPSANLRTASLEVSENFELVIDLSTTVTGLSTSDFIITNGTILKDLSNVQSSYYVSVEPSGPGLVSIQLPANSVQDNDGNGNLASNILEVNYIPEGGGGTKPNVNLRTASLEVSENFELVVDVSTAVTGLSTDDFVVTNGTILKDLSNVRSSYYVSVEPSGPGLVSIQLPANSVQDNDGNGNLASNILEVNYSTAVPEVDILDPVNGAELNRSDVTVTLMIEGDLEGHGAQHLMLTLDDERPVVIENVGSGPRTYTFSRVGAGDHTITSQLTDDRLAPLDFSESEDAIAFDLLVDEGEENCANLNNVALNGTAKQSSAYNGGGAEASLAIDGNTSGNWFADFSVASTSWEEQAYWEVNLGASFLIEDVNIWNRTDCCTDGLSDYYILISEQPFVSDNLSEALAQSGVVSIHQKEIAEAPSIIPMDVKGRYVRIQNRATGFMALAEVEIMGCPLASNNSRGNNQSAYLLPQTAQKGIDAILYPNPVEKHLFVKYEAAKLGEMRYLIADSKGIIYRETTKQMDRTQDIIFEDISLLPPGFYVFYLQVDGFRFVELPFVKIRD
ncbi:MAG: PA14 domain-containing protein [Bacteroidota bacterium]